MPAMLFLHSMCPYGEQCPAHWAGFSSFSSSLKVKCQTDQCDIALFKRHFRSVLCFYRHGIFIICRQNTIKFLFTVDCTICSYLYFFSHAADIIFFSFFSGLPSPGELTSKHRSPQRNLSLSKILVHLPRHCLTVIYGNAAFLVDIGSLSTRYRLFLYIPYIDQLKIHAV